MRTQEIPHERWPYFLVDFTELHHGEHVTVETVHPRAQPPHLCDVPLVGLVGPDPHAPGGGWIDVIAGDSPERQATHSIPRPCRVVLAEAGPGRGVALQIDSADGLTTMIRSEPPPEGMPAGFTIA